MSGNCEVRLDKPYYCPGDTINGFLVCPFKSEHKVRDIRVKFRGEAKVEFKEGKTYYISNDPYFEMQSSILESETTFQPGNYTFPFVFNLPVELPSSVKELEGKIKYQVKVTVDIPWARDYTVKKNFFVYSYLNLNDVPSLKNPAVFTEEKKYLFGNEDIIKIVVNLPKTGYVPDEMISFTCSVINSTSIKVKDVRFNFVQGYELITEERTKEILGLEGEPFAITNGTVLPFSEQTWPLEMRVPGNVYNGDIQHCKIMKAFWELRGEVCLPLMFANLKIKVPITIGSVRFVPSTTTNKA